MESSTRRNTPPVPAEFAGQWIAWNRDQTQIVASGSSFNQVKERAAALGESSVVLAKVPSRDRLSRHGRHLIYMVTVFISLAQGAPDTLPSSSLGMQSSPAATGGSTLWSDDVDDVDDEDVHKR